MSHSKPQYNWVLKKGIQEKLEQNIEEKQLGFDPECTWDRQNREKTSKTSWSLGKGTKIILIVSWWNNVF